MKSVLMQILQKQEVKLPAFSGCTKWEQYKHIENTENSVATPDYSFVILQAKSMWELSGCTMLSKGGLSFLG